MEALGGVCFNFVIKNKTMYISCRGIIKEGIFCQNVDVELDVSRGLFSFLIVGLADKCIGESRERIVSAIKNSGFGSPKTKNHKITVSLVPAGIKKEGVLLDLPISLAYLSATGNIQKDYLENSIFIGELGLDGSIKTNDSLASVINSIIKRSTEKNGIDGDSEKYTNIINIYSNFKEEQLKLIGSLNIRNIRIFKFKFLKDLVNFLKTKDGQDPKKETVVTTYKEEDGNEKVCFEQKDTCDTLFEIDKIIGQEKSKRALLISLCGNYNLIMSGPPGIGKTMLARSAQQLLPTLNTEEYLEVISIHNKPERPFRSPHHTSSYTSIVGGGTPISAGEITKAHKGILFLDELPEFNKNVIESLRQPLEQKVIQINRASDIIELPCDIICICAMNLCPCGNKGVPFKECECTGNRIKIYKQKISKPFLERFHISTRLHYENNNTFLIAKKAGGFNEGNRLNGFYMKKTIEMFKQERAHFKWRDDLLDQLYKKSESNSFSMRVIQQIQDISETICLIEKIENDINSSTKNKEKEIGEEINEGTPGQRPEVSVFIHV